MSSVTIPQAREWTAADLAERFGPIPIRRICRDPEPGTATEDDVVSLVERRDPLCELVDGVLVEKTMGAPEAFLASLLLTYLNMHVLPRRLGFVLGPDGMWRLRPGLVRLPDVAFIAREDTPGGKFPKGAMYRITPRLAVEVLSPGNTSKEMNEKLHEYFAAGVRLVWWIDPDTHTARVFTSPDESTQLDESQNLDGGAVLPGFSLALRTLFEELAEDDPAS